MRTQIFVLSAIFSLIGCSAGVSDEPLPHSKGGSTGNGGGTGNGNGGTTNNNSSGGYTQNGSGGYTQNSSGGAPASGGAASGGKSNSSGGTGSGGTSQGSGGASRGGTSSGSGGSSTMGTGGRTMGMGGATGFGMGGRAAAGAPGSGGTTTGGAGAPAGNCTEADKTVSSNGTGKHCNYTYEYWKDSGTGTLTLTKDGFNVSWSGINDLLGRKGIRPGSGDLVVNYSADYKPNGNSYLCIYGWTKSPLVEYYIVDSWGNWRPPGGQGRVGSVTTDGGTYDVYKIAKTGPNIENNNGAFTQYWSVRTDKKTSGTITIANHFNAWKGLSMPMGSFYEVSMTVEGYQSSGSANVKFTMQ